MSNHIVLDYKKEKMNKTETPPDVGSDLHIQLLSYIAKILIFNYMAIWVETILQRM